MKKNFLISPKAGLICIFSFLLLFIYSCKKDIQEKKQVIQEETPTGSPGGGDGISCVESLQNGFDTVETQTVLGFRLQNNRIQLP